MESKYADLAILIKDYLDSIPEVILDRHCFVTPKNRDLFKNYIKNFYIQDVRNHLLILSESLLVNEPILFDDYMQWLKSFKANSRFSDKELIIIFSLIKETLQNYLPAEYHKLIIELMDSGIYSFLEQKNISDSYIIELNPYKKIAEEYLYHLLNYDKRKAFNMILDLVVNSTKIKNLYLFVFEPVLKEIGRLWQIKNISVAQEHYVTSATLSIIAQLYPYLFSGYNNSKKIIVCCVSGEFHEIGATFVADFFEMEGWNPIYFGANTPHGSIVDAIRLNNVKILALSVTMTYNISSVIELITRVKDQSDLKDVNIIVGGYPFNKSKGLWEKVGADFYAKNPIDALEIANNIFDNL